MPIQIKTLALASLVGLSFFTFIQCKTTSNTAELRNINGWIKSEKDLPSEYASELYAKHCSAYDIANGEQTFQLIKCENYSVNAANILTKIFLNMRYLQYQNNPELYFQKAHALNLKNSIWDFVSPNNDLASACGNNSLYILTGRPMEDSLWAARLKILMENWQKPKSKSPTFSLFFKSQLGINNIFYSPQHQQLRDFYFSPWQKNSQVNFAFKDFATIKETETFFYQLTQQNSLYTKWNSTALKKSYPIIIKVSDVNQYYFKYDKTVFTLVGKVSETSAQAIINEIWKSWSM